MQDKVESILGAVLGGSGGFVFGAITLDRIMETIVYTSIGAIVTGLVGGTVGFYVPKVLHRISRKDQ